MQIRLKTGDSRGDLTGRLSRAVDWCIRPRGPVTAPSPEQIRSIVVIKPCCLGDMLMATPVIRALALRYPQASITVVTDEWTKPAIETNPRLDNLILFPASGGMKAMIQIAHRMRPFRFDLGISLDRSPLTALALWIAGVPIRAGIDSESRGVGLTHRVSPEADQHETALYLSTVRELGIDDAPMYPEFTVPDDAIQRIQEFVPAGNGRPLAILHPGGAVNPGVAMLEKRWPATNFGELASLLSEEAGATPVFVGADTDRNAIETSRQFAGTPIIDLGGKLSLAELAALCQRASLFVGNDSGVTHLASAAGAPVVAIFGPTNPARYRPLGRRTRICAPPDSWETTSDADLRYRDLSGQPDISRVPLPQVFNACLELLGESR